MKKLLSLILAATMALGVGASFAEDGFMSIMPISIELNQETASSINVYVNDVLVDLDVAPEIIDGVLMVPVKLVSDALGYDVKWKADDFSVEISKGAQWTQIFIGQNRYFVNRMAPWSLSAAPVIVDDRTLVPLEFFAEILGFGFQIDEKNIYFTEDPAENVTKEGFVKSIETRADGIKVVTIEYELNSTDENNIMLWFTSEETTYIQKNIEVGTPVKAIVAPFMVLIMPPQVGAYLIY